ncbi:MAG: hypothetical protein AAGI51_06080 [Pseudomonadota bacterium]
MLSKIFIGKPVHWLALILGAGGLYFVGIGKWHVSDFNLYTGAVAAAAIFMVAVVIATTRGGEPVTRDPIPDEKD